MSLGIQTKTILPVTLILIFGMSILAFFNYTYQLAQLQNNTRNILEKSVISANKNLKSQLQDYEQLAAMIANMPFVAEQFKKRRRFALLKQFAPGFELLRKNYALAQFQFHTPPATSFLRLHSPSKYGDDLSKFRNLVVQVNKTKEPVSGIEIGRAGIGLRGVQPIFLNGEHIGSVELGGDLSSALQDIKDAFKVEIGVSIFQSQASQVWENQTSGKKEINGLIPFFATDKSLAENFLENHSIDQGPERSDEIMFTEAQLLGKDYYVAIAPLQDYSRTQIGYLEIFLDSTHLIAEFKLNFITNIVSYIAILILVSFAINFSLNRSVIRRLIKLNDAATAVSMGELSEKVSLRSHDELSMLAKSIDRLRLSMKKLLD